MNVIYKNKETKQVWAKRFIIEKFILDKIYRYVDEDSELEAISTAPDASVDLHYIPKAGQKMKKTSFALKSVPVKGVQTKGIRLAPHKIKKVVSDHD